MKTSFLLCAALAGCIDQTSDSVELGNTDQAVSAHARDRVFSIGTDACVYSRLQTTPNAQTFTAWESLGKAPGNIGFTQVTAERNLDGRLNVFAVGTDTHLYSRYQTSVGGGWNPEGWQSLGAGFIAQVTTARNQDGRIEVFTLNTPDVGGTIWHRYQITPNGGWNDGGWEQLGTRSFTQMTSMKSTDGRVEVIGLDPSGHAWQRRQFQPNTGWDADWSSVGPSVSTLRSIQLANHLNVQPHLFALDSSGFIEESLDEGGGVWSTFVRHGNAPVPATRQFVAGDTDGRMSVLAVDNSGVGLRLSQILNSQGGWDPWFQTVQGWTGIQQLATAGDANQGMTVFARKLDTTLEVATENLTYDDPISFYPMVSLDGLQSAMAAIDQE